MSLPVEPETEQFSVSFPISESSSRPVPQPTPLPRPFRRISLPSFPSVYHRNSVISVSSIDSDSDGLHRMAISSPNRLTKVPVPPAPKTRPMSIDSPRLRNRRRGSSTKPTDRSKALKRKQVVDEFHVTEKVYVEGLELIYSQFLTPIVNSLETTQPLLDRPSLTTLFSNFIDIWNLHHSFLSALSNHLGDDLTTDPPPLSPILISHFPYLSLYNPFITSFPSMISALTDMTTPPSALRPNPRYDQSFATFISTQERDPRCGKLKLRDWLLTIVQRCPRYLLLLKDLIKYTEEEDPEHSRLNSVLALVSKITTTLNSSLETHAQILSLLSLQRSTSGLPFQLIEPGRTLIKRGPLLQVEQSSPPRDREFLLFSDCLIWLSNEDNERPWNMNMNIGWNSSTPTTDSNHYNIGNGSGSTSQTSNIPLPPVSRRHGSLGEERWNYKGRLSLIDFEVIVVPARTSEEETRFEVLSPESSFVLYAASPQEREDWVLEIRSSKAQLLASLNAINPNSTLTSSSSTNHVRLSLQALPFPPSDERIASTIRVLKSTMNMNDFGEFLELDRDFKEGLKTASPNARKEKHGNGKGREKLRKPPIERRMKVDHWVPAIWIPDAKTDCCMRCGKAFMWRRRRHHCRLCGRCVCAGCSGRTFFISDSNSKETSSKPARACDICYETVFPVIPSTSSFSTNSPTKPNSNSNPDPNPNSNSSSSFLLPTTSTNLGVSVHSSSNQHEPSQDTITSLSKLPSWISMPSLPTSVSQPQALMFDLDISSIPVSGSDITGSGSMGGQTQGLEEREIEDGKRGRVRLKSIVTRPKSYHKILEDFQHSEQHQYPHSQHQHGHSQTSTIDENTESSTPQEDPSFTNINNEEFGIVGGVRGGGREEYDSPLGSPPPLDWLSQPPSPSPRRRKEDTARRSKRFSLPAIALQPTSVTARTTSMSMSGQSSSSGAGAGASSGSGSGGASSATSGVGSGISTASTTGSKLGNGGNSNGNKNDVSGNGSRGSGYGNGDSPALGRLRRISLVSAGKVAAMKVAKSASGTPVVTPTTTPRKVIPTGNGNGSGNDFVTVGAVVGKLNGFLGLRASK